MCHTAVLQGREIHIGLAIVSVTVTAHTASTLDILASFDGLAACLEGIVKALN